MATVTIRGAAAPSPCKNRPTSIIGQVLAKIDKTHPNRKSPYPQSTTGRRPTLSESGPTTNWPRAKPRKNTDTTYCVSLILAKSKADPSNPMAGNITSVDKATVDMVKATKIT